MISSNLLLIGDSISIGYTAYVRRELQGKADVYRIATNGRNSAYGVELSGFATGCHWRPARVTHSWHAACPDKRYESDTFDRSRNNGEQLGDLAVLVSRSINLLS